METRRSETQSASTNMTTALQDLETLRNQAKFMVELAQSFNKTLMESEAQRQQLPEDAQFIIQNSMARLGLQSLSSSSSQATLLSLGSQTTLVASETATDGGKEDEKWLEGLARELGILLTGGPHETNKGSGGLMHARGMIALDEVWGAWNRTRGVGKLTTLRCSLDLHGWVDTDTLVHCILFIT
jgi:ESCRT-II complex subunit VPS36